MNPFAKNNKFKAHRINHMGRSFASKLEAALYDLLIMRERAGEIEDIRCQHTVLLGYDIRWKVDYSALSKETGLRVFFEAKGIETDDYKLKLKLWRNGLGKGPLEIWKGTHTRLRLAEIVVPRGVSMETYDDMRKEIDALREKLQEQSLELATLRCQVCESAEAKLWALGHSGCCEHVSGHIHAKKPV